MGAGLGMVAYFMAMNYMQWQDFPSLPTSTDGPRKELAVGEPIDRPCANEGNNMTNKKALPTWRSSIRVRDPRTATTDPPTPAGYITAPPAWGAWVSRSNSMTDGTWDFIKISKDPAESKFMICHPNRDMCWRTRKADVNAANDSNERWGGATLDQTRDQAIDNPDCHFFMNPPNQNKNEICNAAQGCCLLLIILKGRSSESLSCGAGINPSGLSWFPGYEIF
jgi:hypothetical protein